MTKAVIFDLDNTLYDFDAAHAVGFRTVKAFACAVLALAPEQFDALHAAADRTLKARAGTCAAIHNRLLRYQVLLEQLGRPVALAPDMAAIYWTALMGAMRATPGAHETLKALRSKGLSVGVGTNMTADYQYEKLLRLGLMPLVDFVVTSEEASAEKPEARFFALCAQKAGCAPSECAFVGDHLQGDVEGALAAGMRAFWFRPRGDAPAPDGTTAVAALPELLPLLR